MDTMDRVHDARNAVQVRSGERASLVAVTVGFELLDHAGEFLDWAPELDAALRRSRKSDVADTYARIVRCSDRALMAAKWRRRKKNMEVGL